jgi:hypothetical membrane protein
MIGVRAVKLPRLAGWLGALVYLLCALTAFVFYPHHFDPIHNWLSDLGDTLVNPTGAIFYNTGCIVTALLLAALYLSLDIWRNGDYVLSRLLAIGQISGLVSSFALILTAVFNIGQNPRPHSLFSMLFCVGLTWFLAFTNTALLRHPRFLKPLGVFGFAVGVVDMVYGVFINRPVAEWITISLFIVYVLFLVNNTTQLEADV